MTLNRDELALLAEACDVQRKTLNDTLAYGGGLLCEAERRSIEQERDAYAALLTKIRAALLTKIRAAL